MLIYLTLGGMGWGFENKESVLGVGYTNHSNAPSISISFE